MAWFTRNGVPGIGDMIPGDTQLSLAQFNTAVQDYITANITLEQRTKIAYANFTVEQQQLYQDLILKCAFFYDPVHRNVPRLVSAIKAVETMYRPNNVDDNVKQFIDAAKAELTVTLGADFTVALKPTPFDLLTARVAALEMKKSKTIRATVGANGLLTVLLTSDGTTNGTAIFSSIDSVQFRPVEADNPHTFTDYTMSPDMKT